ncbi:hypothetical protein EPA93_20600 [Ktedonosporobacter rubrisoli]|uniref:HEAT repeat domain-containing protein n=1 Tax=Ktedonosporobacter rubrisoli TaxID=2509675 RepID=A0A4P6JRZ1_KTERU|nr:hypothetical protein [Ktedonosporobacter rubrisoli]QBD78267.1 hypothetical protein EPA93_20600 [Ktedonosporobacter rubrisoli]
MSQPMNSLLADAHLRLMIMHRLPQLYRYFQPISIAQLQNQIEKAVTPEQLDQAVNALQERIWKLPVQDQQLLRNRLVQILSTHALNANYSSLRLQAAQWLRLLAQAGLISNPQEIFVTLVTATMIWSEKLSYLRLIADCFLAFHYPYPAFAWHLFPDNQTFYPLAPLLKQANEAMQEALIAIFAELSDLNDPQIIDYLLPVALSWSNHANADYRRQVTPVLAHINHKSSQEALKRLQFDADPIVRASAKQAASNSRVI